MQDWVLALRTQVMDLGISGEVYEIVTSNVHRFGKYNENRYKKYKWSKIWHIKE